MGAFGHCEGTVSDPNATVVVNGVQVTWDNGWIQNGSCEIDYRADLRRRHGNF